MRNAKIVCTLGPASDDEVTIRGLADAGMTVARINASHGTREDRAALIERIRQVDETVDHPVATMLDLKGPEIRTAEVDTPVQLAPGDQVRFIEGEAVSGDVIGLSLGLTGVEPGDRVLLDDGRIETVVTAVEGETVHATVESGGDLDSRRGVNVPGVTLDIELVTTTNFLTYWTEMKQGEYDLILDAAHFTDYRIQEMGYIPLAKMPGEVSYTLITHPDTFVFEPIELTGKPIGSLASPSLGMVRMLEMFPNPLRQPRIIEAPTTERIIELLDNGKAVAGIIPTPLLNNYPQFNVVVTTEAAPHVTFSASPTLPDSERAAVQAALLQAGQNEAGRSMLEAIGFQPLERPTADIYAGYAELLSDMWGY